jgi:hypothetical protein
MNTAPLSWQQLKDWPAVSYSTPSPLGQESYAYKCCRLAGIKSVSKHYKYKKPGESRTYPNLLLAGINIDGPSQCIVSDMTAFYVKNTYYELLYGSITRFRPRTFLKAWRPYDILTDFLEFTKKFPGVKHILHSDQGSVYASKDFNQLLPAYNITRSMSRAGTPTDNAAMESINGWMKAVKVLRFVTDG